MNRNRRNPGLTVVLAWLAVLTFGALLLRSLPLAATRPSIGFSTIYTASRLVLEGTSLAESYRDDWFIRQTQRFVPGVVDIYRPNPPTAALLVMGLAPLGYSRARLAWTALSLACLVCVWLKLKNTLPARGLWVPGFLLLLLAFQPLQANLWFGQSYILLLGMLVLVWVALEKKSWRLAGLGLGLVFGLKTSLALVWLLLLRRRYWAALAWAVGTVLAVGAVSLPWLGWESWKAYGKFSLHASGVIHFPEQANTAYQTLPGFFRHLFAADAQWNPSPWISSPRTGETLTLAAGFAVLGISWYSLRQADLAFSIAVLTLASLMLNPWTMDYHYTFFLMPLAVLAADYRKIAARPLQWLALGLAAALVALPLPYVFPQVQAGAWALLAYPKLYGAILLWRLLLAAIRQHGRSLGPASASLESGCGL